MMVPLKLFGSTTSPYARRLRMWMVHVDYEFVNIDIFSPEGREILKANNPTLKIPMLQEEDRIIYDSRVIFRYLNAKFMREETEWQYENNLTLIDAANDSFIELLLLQRSGVEPDSDLMFVKLQRERVASTMQVLEEHTAKGDFEYWNYGAISLYCLIDWLEFRELCDMSPYKALLAFKQSHSDKPEVIDTDPRL